MVILHSYVKQPNGIWCSNLQEDAEKEPFITMIYVKFRLCSVYLCGGLL